MKSYTGFANDNVLLSIGRAILRKQQRENRDISDYEARGHAMVIQGRYNFVKTNEQELFCNEVVQAFQYVKQRKLQSVSKLAYLDFQKDELLGNSILDDELINDLNQSGAY
jgi:hypothetical protein